MSFLELKALLSGSFLATISKSLILGLKVELGLGWG